MKKINLEIKVLSPLAIGRKKPGGNVSEVESFIPGSVIRGALANQILKQSNQLVEDDDDFHKLFLGENPAIFQNAYLGNSKIKSEVRVVPATALSSKEKSGFKSEAGNNGVFDTLIDRFCAEKYEYIYDPNCPTDYSRVDIFSGIYSQKNGKYYSHSAKNTRLLTRVGINRRRATSEEQILYSIEVLNESLENTERPVIYTGRILVCDDLASLLLKFIQDNSRHLYLGGSISRGLGKVEITVFKPPNEFKSNAKNQIDLFNQKIHDRWNEWGESFGIIYELPKTQIYFTIDLQADAILRENWQCTTVISPEMLQQFTGVNDGSLQLHTAYTSYEYRSGWNTAWGLMKDVQLVTNKGGVYLFSTDNQDLWLKAWEDLEVYGVGDRTCEGFGQVQICNEFHNILRESAT